MDSMITGDFDFDTFARLASEDPEEFERRRRQLIETTIAAAPDRIQRKLHHLQCRADLIREAASSPLVATQKFSSMMWDSVVGSGGLREVLNAVVAGDSSVVTPQPLKDGTAKVLPFPGTK